MLSTYLLINTACLLLLATGYGSAVLGENEGVILSSGGIGSLVGFWLECRRPKPPIQKAGDTVYAVYVPRRKEDEPRDAEACGGLLHWRAEWRIDKGRYRGEWAMVPVKAQPSLAWVPLGDLVIQDRRKRKHVR